MVLLGPGPGGDGVLEAGQAGNVGPAQHVAPHGSAGLAHAEGGGGVGEEGLGEAGQVLDEEGGRLLGQAPALELTVGGLGQVGDVEGTAVCSPHAGHRPDDLPGPERRQQGARVARKMAAVGGDGLRQGAGTGGKHRAHVDVLHDELHRRELAGAGHADRPGRARVDDQVGVPRGVHEGPCPHGLRAPLGGHDGRLHALAVDHHVAHEGVQEQLDALLVGDDVVEETLGRPGHVQEHGAALERHRPVARP